MIPNEQRKPWWQVGIGVGGAIIIGIAIVSFIPIFQDYTFDRLLLNFVVCSFGIGLIIYSKTKNGLLAQFSGFILFLLILYLLLS